MPDLEAQASHAHDTWMLKNLVAYAVGGYNGAHLKTNEAYHP